ncbi:hypothetical protein QBC38DRAFT_478545 [Podospora fimiseda]|uniref:Uncharacterized protein n=1 Tax=Podospora fimiseda TaxID=252190 RepID=A0AAN7BPM0_9PEZI|nr:hypothetical protein QBC38DRAFT_478545 [Podospora fimiseda]
MQLSANNLFFLSLLFGACSAAPAPQGYTDLPILTVPQFPGAPITASCYTATTTVTRSSCTRTKCPVPTKPIACPAVIHVTTIEVPCHNDSCPKTTTKTATAKCPGCTTGCVIPTHTETVTTGCPTKPPTLTLFPVKRNDPAATVVASLPVITPATTLRF